ncbi:MAG: nucleotidyltransferase domain-containing protein [Candidatus Uhrbacteria bacterium]|nr:nucleotidyltransferase domain-containing protein [Candidatus Uhrbacteria bacterium]
MVNIPDFLREVRLCYGSALGKNISLLIVGGSIGRGNYVPWWSDADLLLVLKKTDSKSLHLVMECEKHIQAKYGIDMDTMVTSKDNIEHTPPEKLHGKIKNFLFFLPKEKVLIRKSIKVQSMSSLALKYGFWATYAEQDKNFLRRNTDLNIEDKKSLQVIAKKNIKIIFLILKQYLANSVSVPSTYEEVIYLGTGVLSTSVIRSLKKYENIRLNNQLASMSETELRNIVSESVDIFNGLGKLVKYVI